MKSKPIIFLFLFLFLSVSFSDLCAGEDQKPDLMVEKITFTRDKSGGERVALFCNKSCVPELSSLGGENPRVVMDMKGVFLIQAKDRNINTKGKLVKRVRSYLNKQTKILRVVLDMESSKYYIVRPIQDPSDNMYALMIYEKIRGTEDTKGSPLSQEMRITILRPGLNQGEDKLQEAAPKPEKPMTVKGATYSQSLKTGRSQFNAGEYAAAVDTFTKIIEANPEDSLSYRLRGNAYDNLADRQRAVEDWTQAARLGDTTLQSYLDFLQVKWRDNPAP